MEDNKTKTKTISATLPIFLVEKLDMYVDMIKKRDGSASRSKVITKNLMREFGDNQ